MCLAIPMRVVEVDGFNARCEAKGVEREVSLFMMQGEELVPGDHVLVMSNGGFENIHQRILDALAAGAAHE